MIDVTDQFPVLLEWPRSRMIPAWVDGIAVHHTAVDPQAADPEVGLVFPAANMTVEDELNHIAVIHLYHKSKGYGGFAYHFISFPSGRSYHVVPLTQWGAHVGLENDHLYGIVAAGDFRDSVPGLAQQWGLASAVQDVDDFLNREVLLKPHLAYGGTTCPGNRWQEWVPGLRQVAEEYEVKLRLIQRQGGGAQYVTDWIRKWPLPSGRVRDEMVGLDVLDGKVLVVTDGLFHAIPTVCGFSRPRLVWD